jgi:hypothetical protein
MTIKKWWNFSLNVLMIKTWNKQKVNLAAQYFKIKQKVLALTDINYSILSSIATLKSSISFPHLSKILAYILWTSIQGWSEKWLEWEMKKQDKI